MPSAIAPGETLPVTLAWRAERETEARLKVFAHLLDDDGNVIAQHDAEPANWERPTTSWVAGEYLLDAHLLAIPGTMPAGTYAMVVGLYDSETGQRLMTETGADQQRLAERIEITP